MMRRVAVDFTWYFDKAVHAGPKARKDVTRTLKSEGYETVTLFYPSSKNPKSASRKRAAMLMRLYFTKLIGAKEVIFQYPSMLPVWYLRFLKYQGIKVILLIHDLDRLRQGHQDLSRLERNTFNAASGLIVHTPSMADYLQSQGIKAPQQILYLFDYYTDTDSFRQPENIGSIVFCGNLGKSGFLSVFDEQNWNLPTYLYGVGAKKQYGNPDVHYMGVFQADDPSDIEGAWGLVWDGPDADTCSTSPIGRYLSYNTSHKISLYLATGKPVIIWSGCALAQWMVDRGLGIAIDSLHEIAGKLKDISQAEYSSYAVRVSGIQRELLSGDFLKQILTPCRC